MIYLLLSLKSFLEESKIGPRYDGMMFIKLCERVSYISNNRVKLIIVLKGNLQLTSMRVVANNRVIK